MSGIIANKKHIITMNKKEYLNPIVKVIELESSYPVCLGLSGQASGTLSSFDVDDFNPIWD